MEKNTSLLEDLIKSDRIINNQSEKMADYEELVKSYETQILQLKESCSINIKRNISFNYSFDNSAMDTTNMQTIPEMGETVADIKITALEKDIRDLIVQKEDLQQKLSIAENEKTSIKKSYEEAEETINSLLVEVDRLKNSCYEKNNELMQQKANILCLKQSVDVELNKVKDSFVALKDNHENFTKKFENEIQSNCQQIIDVFNEHLKSISLLSHFKHTLEIQLEDVCTENTKIQQEYQKSKSMIEELENMTSIQTEQIMKFQQESNESSKEIERLQLIINDYHEKINTKNDDENNYREKCEQLMNELETIKMEAKKFEVKMKNFQKAYIIENQSFVAERKTKERLLRENMEMEKEIGKLKKTIAQFESNNVDFVGKKSNPIINQKQNKLPDGTGIKFEMADEEGEFMDPNKIEIPLSKATIAQPPPSSPFPQERIKILRQRNSMLQPHLRSSYPVELQKFNSNEKILKDSATVLRNPHKNTRERVVSSTLSENDIPAKRSKL
ncbi:hypothetical protein BLA29_002409 [Euroglyphus maynei]|uniref:Uncharacterized protein n=1 Tax=Euroglyphus maynei TaxID=6958 RepID=A0A1Y3BJQ1_EURMA|nr:hypothetical protein BLA29_002409 [Euroglyphus maynei]